MGDHRLHGLQKTAFGVHTWREAYLTPVYRSLLDHFRSEGCRIGNFKKEKGPLMNFIISGARLHGAELPGV